MGNVTRSASSGSAVVMVKSAEHGDCGNAPLDLRATWNGLLVPESLVRACLVEEAHVLGNDTTEMGLTED